MWAKGEGWVAPVDMSWAEDPGVEEITREKVWEQDAQWKFNNPGGEFAKQQETPKPGATTSSSWPDPLPIGDGLLPVLPFDPEFLPPSIMDWIYDNAERKQCPIEFVAIPTIVALGTLLGGKLCVRPKQRDDWTLYPNFWGMIISVPSKIKSGSIDDVLKPVRGFEKAARIAHAAAMEVYELDLEQWQDTRKKDRQDGTSTAGPKPVKPIQKRYLTSDCTYEGLSLLMETNPDGVLVHRDELISLLHDLDKAEKSNTKQFFMTAWNGSSPYTTDRVGRGVTYIERTCLSIIGGATPSTITKYIGEIEGSDDGGNGLFQRFNLAIWPDISPDWHYVDRRPDRDARGRAYDLFAKFNELDGKAIGGQVDDFDPEGTPFLHFAPDAQ